jgi:hypothetical protein
VKPTRWPVVVGLVALFALFGWALAAFAYGELPTLPTLAALSSALIAVFELAVAWIVWRKVRHGRGRGLHPLQVARAAVLGKASSATGAILFGLYGGFFLQVAGRADVRAAVRDAETSGLSALACLLLLVTGLLLERACRTPSPPD